MIHVLDDYTCKISKYTRVSVSCTCVCLIYVMCVLFEMNLPIMTNSYWINISSKINTKNNNLWKLSMECLDRLSNNSHVYYCQWFWMLHTVYLAGWFCVFVWVGCGKGGSQ